MRKVFFYMLFVFFVGLKSFADECDFIRFNECTSCHSPYAFPVSGAEICRSLCPEREFKKRSVGNGIFFKTCSLKKCPDNLPFQSVYGSCFKTQEESLSDDGNSIPENINDSDIRDIFENAPPCSKEKPLRRWDGSCFSCDEKSVVVLDSACHFDKNCENICSERTVLYNDGGNIPSVPKCPKSTPLMDETGICHSCHTKLNIPFDFNTRLCQEACPNIRHLKNGKCVLK